MVRQSRGVWAKRVHRWKRSGLSAAAFALSEGVNASTLKWWSSQLGRPTPPSAPPVVEVVVPAIDAPAMALKVEVRDGVQVTVPVGFDEETLRRLLLVLEGG